MIITNLVVSVLVLTNGVAAGAQELELRECLEQAYGDKIGTYTMKGNEVERWRKALREKGGAK